MHIKEIRESFPKCKIEIGDYGDVWVHAGGAYPLQFKDVQGVKKKLRKVM
jgi:hypothetical protein